MRSIVIVVLSLFALTFSWQAQAESRHCAGGCDRYGNPVYNIPVESEDWVSPNPPSLSNDYLYPPGYQPAPRYRRVAHRHRHVRHRQVRHHRHYRQKRRVRKHRHHRRYREHHSHRRYARPTLRNRTKYCRDEIEWTSSGHGIRRCIWVRNDLIHRYEGRGYHRH